jgi:hypothetical protein
VLRADDVNHGLQHDLDKLGIAKTAREEKKRERDQKLKDAEMMKMYRQVVLKEEPGPALVQLGIAPAGAPPTEKAKAEEVGSFGD